MTDPFGNPFKKPEPEYGLDSIGWFLATLHDMLGHNKAAQVIGVPAGPKDRCLICLYHADPTPERKNAVIRALGVPRRNEVE